ncbi:MAG: nucleotidyl transferase AbiEii/AbiGii toxin family protein [Verrucomicrobiae bacterium]|nr:nucleotidyl transferase AbiEii/AbiGii toxin family protein [Verrucomicrobiae bacterium]
MEVIHAKATGQGLRHLLIGGQAVNAYGEPRATLDVDLLIPVDERGDWKQLLVEEGFRCCHEADHFAQFSPPYGVSWRLDLMLVGADTFSRLWQDSTTRPALGIQARVPSIEHLIALKLHALRHGPCDRADKDFADIVTLARVADLDPESPAVREVFLRHGNPELHERLRRALGNRA